MQAEIVGDTGPYTNAGPAVMGFAALVSSGPYYVPNARMESFTVFTNNPISGAMRGFGGPQVCFACERQMDELAHRLGLDPLEIRLRNGLKTGEPTPSGAVIREAGGMRAGLLEAARLGGWADRNDLERRPAPHLRRGWGLASSWFVIGLGFQRPDYAGVALEMAGDGSVTLRTSVVEIGQGGHTAMAILAAEQLGVELSAIRVVGPDTQQTPDAGGTVATRQTFVSGNALLKAASAIRQNLLITAAEETGLPLEILDLHGGQLYAEGEALSISVGQLAAKCQEKNRALHAEGFYVMEYPRLTDAPDSPYGVGPSSFGSQLAQVLVDTETGQVTVERLIAVHNAGRVINRGGALGQLQGSGAMGVGFALTEQLLVNEGRILNNSLESYVLPTALDLPAIEAVLLEIPEPLGPLGAGGLGEPVLMATAPAIANAIEDAVGVSLNRLPLTAERVWGALQNGRADGTGGTPVAGT